MKAVFAIIALIFMTACTIFAGYYLIFRKAVSNPTTQSELELPIITIRKEGVGVKSEFPARVVAKKQAEIRPQVGGIVTKVMFKQGGFVNKGDVLFEIDKEPFLTKIYAPISGIAGISNVTEGTLIAVGRSEALTTITDLGRVYVDISAPNSRHFIKTGTLVEIEELNSKGVLIASEATINPETDSITLRSEFENKNAKLLPGSFVITTIHSPKFKAMLVPQRVTFRDKQNNLSVWVVEKDNTVRTQKIKAEQTLNDKWIAIEGLEDGAVLVYEGIHMLEEGMRIKPLHKQI